LQKKIDMSSFEKRKEAFVKLGQYLLQFLQSVESETDLSAQLSPIQIDKFREADRAIRGFIGNSTQFNPWFVREFLLFSIHSIALSLAEEELEKWTSDYPQLIEPQKAPKNIAIVMAGNIPLVGFHDYLCVVLSGHKLIAKLSKEDAVLLPLFHQILSSFYPALSDFALFTSEKLANFDAVIATGSDNTARYFDYYFGKYPNIIRKNRNGVAVLDGKENQKELELLADDIFLYFGLGCRNVSKLFVPLHYDFKNLFLAFEKYKDLFNHNKYRNNYDYNKSIYLINKERHLDNGFVLLKEEESISSPISVLFYEHYTNPLDLNAKLLSQKQQIQCVISGNEFDDCQVFPFGSAQNPMLSDYADGVDTLKFLLSLK